MAKPSWVTLSKTSGSGDSSFNVSASAHTGRKQRSGTVSVTGAGVTRTFTVAQSPKALSVSFNNGTSLAVDKAGGNITIKGKTNAAKLEFWFPKNGATVGTHSTSAYTNFPSDKNPSTSTNGQQTYLSEKSQLITLPASYSAGGVTTNNNVAITNDPGASNEFEFSIVIPFAANTASVTQSITLNVLATGDNGETTSASITLVQAAGAQFMNIYKESDHTTNLNGGTITLVQAGTAQTVYVDSNTSWTIS